MKWELPQVTLTKTALRAIVFGVIALLIAAALIVPGCLSRHKAARDNRVTTGQQGATIEAGEEALNTFGNVMENRAATDAAVAQGRDEVRAAPEGQKGKAGVNAACRFKANRDKPECQGRSK